MNTTDKTFFHSPPDVWLAPGPAADYRETSAWWQDFGAGLEARRPPPAMPALPDAAFGLMPDDPMVDPFKIPGEELCPTPDERALDEFARSVGALMAHFTAARARSRKP